MLAVYEGVQYFFVHYGYTLEMLLAIALFSHTLERRSYFAVRAAGCYLMTLVCYMRLSGWRDRYLLGLLLYLGMTAVLYLSLLICYQASGWVFLFILTGADTTQHIAFRIYTVILSYLGMGYDSLLAGILNTCVIAMVYSVVYLMFRPQLQEINEHAYNGKSNIIIGVAGFTAAILIYRFEAQYHFMEQAPDINLMFSAYAVLANAFLLVILHGVFRSKKLVDEMSMLEEVVERQRIHYELVKENMDNVNIKCHDMKQQISMFENRIDRDALQEIKSIIRVYDTTFRTGSEVLDVFLQEKLLACEKDGIQLDCIVDGESVSFIRPADLYALVGNALDNAMEAVRQIDNPERRIITLSIRKNMNMILIHVDNEYVGEIAMEGDLPRSTKGDALNHGYGMRSMRLIAEKYGGTLSIARQGHIFNVNILIPMEEGTT